MTLAVVAVLTAALVSLRPGESVDPHVDPGVLGVEYIARGGNSPGAATPPGQGGNPPGQGGDNPGQGNPGPPTSPGNPPGQGDFSISDEDGGPAAVGLYPGETKQLRLEVENPFSFTIRVTRLEVEATGVTTRDGAACDPDNVSSAGLTETVDIPPGTPEVIEVPITMIAKPEDGCQGATFLLAYEATAVNATVADTPGHGGQP